MNTEKRLYQWDTGQKLVGCTGLYVDFPIGDEIYRVETTDGMCIIPDELLQTSGGHKVYECMTNNTIRSFAFSVTPRPQPPDYVFTPTERLTFEGLVQKVDDAVADMIRRADSGEFDGHTPVKGTDYFTASEIQQIQNEVSSGAIGDFKSAVDAETDRFNANATEQVNAYNQNDSEKTASYNTNATEKLNAYNSNADNRVAEFNAQTEQIQTDISELKSDLSEYVDFGETIGYVPRVKREYVDGALNYNGTISGDTATISLASIIDIQDVEFVFSGDNIAPTIRMSWVIFDSNGTQKWSSSADANASNGYKITKTANALRNYGAYNEATKMIIRFTGYNGSEKVKPNCSVNASFESDAFSKLNIPTESVKKFRNNDSIGNYLNATIPLDNSIFDRSTEDDEALPVEQRVKGYLSVDGVTFNASVSYRLTPYLEVLEGTTINVQYLYTASWVKAFFYDENKKFLSKETDTTAKTYETVNINVPYGAKYVRVVTVYGDREKLKLSYVGDIDRNYFANDVVKDLYNKSNRRIVSLFNESASKPIITIIDDDTVSTEAVKLYHDTCVNLGIKGNYACITNQLSTVSGLKEMLKTYEEEGFGVVTHCHLQIDAYNSNSSRNIASCEADLTKAQREMTENGFLNYDFWCTPFGVYDTDIQNLAKRRQMKCLVTSGFSKFETTEPQNGRYGLWRMSLQQSDEISGITTMEYIKSKIDEAVACNGWVLLTTHFGEPNGTGRTGWSNHIDRFNEIMQYALDKGCEFKTLPEAWAIREPIYRFYEMF